METFWFIILMTMLTVYVVLDGYDFGAGIVHLFFARSEKDRQLITRSIGPFWDANEVWLIAAGGVLFFAFPRLYAASFSGFYLPLIMILWLLIFRAIGLELRGLVDHELWRGAWDKAFGVASLLLALFFGLALGNVVRGVNLGGVTGAVSAYEPQYFFLPLWVSDFSPLGIDLGIIDWFTLILGLVGLVTLTIHGATWVIFKTRSSINETLKTWVYRLSFVLVALVALSLAAWLSVRPDPFRNFIEMPLFWLFPLLTLAGLGGLMRIRSYVRDGLGFLFSTLFIVGAAASTAVSVWPVLLPSSNATHPDLTVYNTATDAYGLQAGLYWWPLAAALVVLYVVVQYRIFKGKMDDVGYGEH
jgi:cytochrome bd ubiquinol oxidase subunit II